MTTRSMVVVLFFLATTCVVSGCFWGGEVSIEKDTYELTLYGREAGVKTHTQISYDSLGRPRASGKTRTYVDFLYLSNEVKTAEVWLRLGYNQNDFSGTYTLMDSSTKHLSDTPEVSVDEKGILPDGIWPGSKKAVCTIRSNGMIYDCISGTVKISRKGVIALSANMSEAKAQKRDGDDSTHNISLYMEGMFLRQIKTNWISEP